MNPEVFNSLQHWYADYMRQFVDVDGPLSPMLQVKADHSARVADLMEAIARDLGLEEGDVRAARVLGLFHDVGRFSQYEQFRTYNDRGSVNHGLRGLEVLEQGKVLASCSTNDRDRIAVGVRFHNEHHLPDHVDDGALLFVKMIRDADKLDICRTLMSAWESGELLNRPELVFNIDLNRPPNPAAIAELRAGRTVSYGHIRSMADFFITLLSWVYDFNFHASYRRLREWNLVAKIVQELPPDAAVQEAVGAATRYFDQQLKKNSSSQRGATVTCLR